jgi:hypothetical protein
MIRWPGEIDLRQNLELKIKDGSEKQGLKAKGQ